MKVWVVLMDHYPNGSDRVFYGVFASEMDAQDFIARQPYPQDRDAMYVEEHEVQP